MSRSILTASVALAALMMVSSADAQSASRSRAFINNQNVPSSGLALEGYCPVAYFALNKAVKGTSEFASEHNGAIYYFVNADAKRAFDENPAKFAPAYGGWCATGMALGERFPVDPTSFKIVDGRLMLFLQNPNVDALKLWNGGNEREQVRKADAHWQTKGK